MKTTVFLFLFLLSFSAPRAQVIDLTGTWTMFELTYITDKGTEKMTEDQIKAKGLVTDFLIMKDGKFKQTSNMAESGTMDTYEGTWKLAGNELMLNYPVGENGLKNVDIVWKAEFKDGSMHLSRSSPNGSFTVINSYRRK